MSEPPAPPPSPETSAAHVGDALAQARPTPREPLPAPLVLFENVVRSVGVLGEEDLRARRVGGTGSNVDEDSDDDDAVPPLVSDGDESEDDNEPPPLLSEDSSDEEEAPGAEGREAGPARFEASTPPPAPRTPRCPDAPRKSRDTLLLVDLMRAL